MDPFEEWLMETGYLLLKDLGIYIEDLDEELLFYFQLDYKPQEIVYFVAKPLNKLLLETVENWLF
jgi:hypothetical protein